MSTKLETGQAHRVDQDSRRLGQPQTEPSLTEKVGFWGVVRIAATLIVFLIMTLFYTILPIAGLGLLPFLFFGCICLIVGVCDDLGVYR